MIQTLSTWIHTCQSYPFSEEAKICLKTIEQIATLILFPLGMSLLTGALLPKSIAAVILPFCTAGYTFLAALFYVDPAALS
jgi:hypothetical protein